MDRWYFAYGSNLLISQMSTRTGPIAGGGDAPRIAVLANHEVTFTMRGGDGRLYANIIASKETVWGVLYRCTPAALAKLDDFERGYSHRDVVVTEVASGVERVAVAYIALPDRLAPAGRPSAEYLARIVTGAREFGLPEEYIRKIERVAGG